MLFTSKLFSAHVATNPDSPTDATLGWDEFGADWRYFFDCMLAPMARPAATALSDAWSLISAARAAALEPAPCLPSPWRPS